MRWGNREEKKLSDDTVCHPVFYACLEVFRSEKTNNNEGALMATIDSMNRDTTRLSDGPDWTFELLETYLAEVDRVAKLYRLDTYPHQIEVIH